MRRHYTAAKLCYLSYAPKRYKEYTVNDLSNNETDIQAYSIDIKGCRYIIVRGSSSIKDWWRNLQTNLLLAPFKEEGYTGKVRLHTGFYSGYLSIQPKVLELADTQLKLVLSGHSLGGAIALIAGVDINYQLDKKVEAVTFGSPPVGNQIWRDSAERRLDITGYCNRFDIVPYLLKNNYHAGDQIKLSAYNFDPHHAKNYCKNLRNDFI